MKTFKIIKIFFFAVLIVSFYLPWSDAFSEPMTGFSIPQIASEYDENNIILYALYLSPVLSVIGILFTIFSKPTKLLSFVAGILCLLYFFLVYRQNSIMADSLVYGAFLTMFASVGLVLLPFIERTSYTAKDKQ